MKGSSEGKSLGISGVENFEKKIQDGCLKYMWLSLKSERRGKKEVRQEEKDEEVFVVE